MVVVVVGGVALSGLLLESLLPDNLAGRIAQGPIMLIVFYFLLRWSWAALPLKVYVPCAIVGAGLHAAWTYLNYTGKVAPGVHNAGLVIVGCFAIFSAVYLTWFHTAGLRKRKRDVTHR